MINEGIEIENEKTQEKQENVTDKQVGRIITEAGMKKVAEKLGENVVASTKTEQSKNE